jgi:signal transduction histidine kinase
MANLETFSYSVAHDLKAPVRSMKSYSQLLLEEYGDRFDDGGRDYAERIAKSADQMDTLIRDLLAYSRMSQEELEVRPVDMNELWKGLLEEYSREIGERRAKVSLEAELPSVAGHAVTLGQVFANLLTNAMKFVAPGVGPLVRIRAERHGPRVRIWVEDNGIGIEPRHHDRLFRIFERLHDQREYPGTGIGLAIVKKAVERMGGECGYESEPGKGSRFWVELPVA